MTPDIQQAYAALPAELQREVADFIEFLTQKWQRQPTPADIEAGRFSILIPDSTAAHTTQNELAMRRQQGLGTMKDRLKTAADFDEPLDDFKEYM